MSNGLLYLNGVIVLLLLIEVSWLWARLLAAREEREDYRQDAEALDRLCQEQAEVMDERDEGIRGLVEANQELRDLIKKLVDEAIARDEEEIMGDDDDDEEEEEEMDEWGFGFDDDEESA